jgi:hypothetical protein
LNHLKEIFELGPQIQANVFEDGITTGVLPHVTTLFQQVLKSKAREQQPKTSYKGKAR